MVNDVTAEVVVMGDSWDAEQCMLHINILEGLAFSKAMQQMSPELDGCTIAIWIDNTSVVGVARKGMSVRSQELNGGHQRLAGVPEEGDHVLGAVCTITTEPS